MVCGDTADSPLDEALADAYRRALVASAEPAKSKAGIGQSFGPPWSQMRRRRLLVQRRSSNRRASGAVRLGLRQAAIPAGPIADISPRRDVHNRPPIQESISSNRPRKKRRYSGSKVNRRPLIRSASAMTLATLSTTTSMWAWVYTRRGRARRTSSSLGM